MVKLWSKNIYRHIRKNVEERIRNMGILIFIIVIIVVIWWIVKSNSNKKAARIAEYRNKIVGEWVNTNDSSNKITFIYDGYQYNATKMPNDKGEFGPGRSGLWLIDFDGYLCFFLGYDPDRDKIRSFKFSINGDRLELQDYLGYKRPFAIYEKRK